VREVWRYGSERAGEEGEKRGSEKRLERGGGKRRLEMGVGASGRCKRVRALSRAARSSHVRTRAPAGFFFAKREDVLNWSTVQPPFYNQTPEVKKNYKAVHMTTVHLPRELQDARSNTRRTFSSRSSTMRPQTLVQPHKPPPRTSSQNGFILLNENRQSRR